MVLIIILLLFILIITASCACRGEIHAANRQALLPMKKLPGLRVPEQGFPQNPWMRDTDTKRREEQRGRHTLEPTWPSEWAPLGATQGNGHGGAGAAARAGARAAARAGAAARARAGAAGGGGAGGGGAGGGGAAAGARGGGGGGASASDGLAPRRLELRLQGLQPLHCLPAGQRDVHLALLPGCRYK